MIQYVRYVRYDMWLHYEALQYSVLSHGSDIQYTHTYKLGAVVPKKACRGSGGARPSRQRPVFWGDFVEIEIGSQFR